MATKNLDPCGQKTFIEGAMNQWWKDSNSINILITGKTGTGKSSLVNAILGKEVATVGTTLDPQTSDVESYEIDVDGVKVIVWDSPGLQDGLNEELSYINAIKRKCKDKIDLFLYCVSMENLRFIPGSRDIDAMQKLTDNLGKEIWNNGVIILSCANNFITTTRSHTAKSDDREEKVEKAYNERFKMWELYMRECLKEELKLSAETIEKLPIVPTGMRGIPLLMKGFSPWLSHLWMESLLATKHNAQPALVKMNLHRLRTARDIHSEEEFQELLKRESIIISDQASKIGKEINAEAAGRAVGECSGTKAIIAHIVERVFSVRGITVQKTTVTINDEELVVEIHLE